jgi:hypothetical protein
MNEPAVRARSAQQAYEALDAFRSGDAMIDLARADWTLDSHLDATRSTFTATARARE